MNTARAPPLAKPGCLCALHIRLMFRFPPTNIQHTQRPCAYSSCYRDTSTRSVAIHHETGVRVAHAVGRFGHALPNRRTEHESGTYTSQPTRKIQERQR